MPARSKPASAPLVLSCPQCHRVVSGSAHVVDPSTVLHRECVAAWERKQRGLEHQCPQCGTRGKVPDPASKRMEWRDVQLTEEEQRACGYDGCRGCGRCMIGRERRQVEVVPDKTCPLCNGVGWLEKEPKPVTRTEVVGWAR